MSISVWELKPKVMSYIAGLITHAIVSVVGSHDYSLIPVTCTLVDGRVKVAIPFNLSLATDNLLRVGGISLYEQTGESEYTLLCRRNVSLKIHTDEISSFTYHWYIGIERLQPVPSGGDYILDPTFRVDPSTGDLNVTVTNGIIGDYSFVVDEEIGDLNVSESES